jgi:hypothetical protein
VLCTGLFAAQAQDQPCKLAKVLYSAPTEQIAKSMSLSSYTAEVSASVKRDASPQGTRWMVRVDPDYMKPGPWNTTLFIGDLATNTPFLKAEFRDHGNTFGAQWINENLIWIQVWWGRVASSDLILDVSKKQFIYNQLANYVEVTFCKEE